MCRYFFGLGHQDFSANMADNLIARLGIEQSYGYVLGLALMFTLMLNERKAFIIAAVVLLSLNANMPVEFSLNMGLDRDYYAGFMMALLL